MCRLCALTANSENFKPIKNQFFDRFMMVSQTDEAQNDGWGITDGQNLWKTCQMYSGASPIWTRNIDENSAYLGHVRKSSSGTGKEDKESHPYLFLPECNNDFEPLYAAHNGYIQGTSWQVAKYGVDPNTDSWRAFKELESLLVPGQKISPHVIEHWLESFEETSQFAFLLHWGGEIYAIRHDRPLFIATIDNGFLINTSPGVMNVTRHYAKEVHGLEIGPNVEIAKDSMLVISPGPQNVIEYGLNISMRAKPVYTRGNGSSPITQTPLPAMNGTISMSKPVTKPRVTEDSPKDSSKDYVENNAGSIWVDICNMLNPIRASMIVLWIFNTLEYEYPLDIGFNTLNQVLKKVSVEDLLIFSNIIKRLCPDGKLNKRQNMLVNAWNHIITQGSDIEFHCLMFGDGDVFWQKPKYNTLFIDDESAVDQLRLDIFEVLMETDFISYYTNMDRNKIAEITAVL